MTLELDPSVLTQRERTIVRMLSAGADGKTIAQILGINYNTYRHHVYNTLTKCGLDNSRQLAIAYINWRHTIEISELKKRIALDHE